MAKGLARKMEREAVDDERRVVQEERVQEERVEDLVDGVSDGDEKKHGIASRPAQEERTSSASPTNLNRRTAFTSGAARFMDTMVLRTRSRQSTSGLRPSRISSLLLPDGRVIVQCDFADPERPEQPVPKSAFKA